MKKLIMLSCILCLCVSYGISQSRSAMDSFDNIDKEEQKVSPAKEQHPAPVAQKIDDKQPAASPRSSTDNISTIAPKSRIDSPTQPLAAKSAKGNKRIEIKGNAVNFIGDDGKIAKTIQLIDEKKNDSEYVLVSRVMAFPSGNKQYVGIATEQSRVLPEYSVVSTTTFHYYDVDGRSLWSIKNVDIDVEPPAMFVSNDGQNIIISSAAIPGNIDEIDYPRTISVYDITGNVIWNIGTYTAIELKMSDNGRYGMLSYGHGQGHLFFDLMTKKTYDYKINAAHSDGFMSIDNNGKISLFKLDEEILDDTVTPFKTKQTTTLIFEKSINE